MKKMEGAIPSGLIQEAVEMIGKATTMTVSEMDSEKKQKLSLAIDHAIHGNSREKAEVTMDGVRQGYGLMIANGVERAHQALETVRQDAVESKGYAIAKGIVNVPAQIVRGMVVDTALEVGQIAVDKVVSALPDLQIDAKQMNSKSNKEHSIAHAH